MGKSTRGATLALSVSLVHFFTTKKTSIMDVSQAGVTGFEPVFTVLETVALPLNYSPLMRNFRMPEYNTILIGQCQ